MAFQPGLNEGAVSMDATENGSCVTPPAHFSWSLTKGGYHVNITSPHHIRGHTIDLRGPRWRSWFRHCATSRKVAGSIADGVIGILH